MSTVAELRSEILGRLETIQTIDRKYDQSLITDEHDASTVQRLHGEIKDLEGKLGAAVETENRRAEVEQKLAVYRTPAERHPHPAAEPDGDDYARKSIGQIFYDDPEYRRLQDSGVFNSPNQVVQFAVSLGAKTSLWQRVMARRQGKALMYGAAAVGGGLVTPDYQPGVVDLLQRPLTVLDIVPTTTTTSNTISYVREDSRTNNAAMVAEATATTGTSGLKPESGMAFSRQTAPVRTAATWVPVTNQMLADAPAMRGMIDNRLMVMLEQTLETQILAGDGTGENFTGILSSGISARARGADNQADALYKAAVVVAVTGQVQPDTIVLNPLDWQTIRLARENAATGTLGGYLMGPPSVVGADTLWGYRVIISQALTAGTGLVGSFRLGGMYFEREGAVIRSGTIDDQFVRNMQTLLVEARGAWITLRPTAFCQVTGLAA